MNSQDFRNLIKLSDFLHLNEIWLMFQPFPIYETNAIQLHFYGGSFDTYHSGLAWSVIFFVPVCVVKISTVLYSKKIKKNKNKNKIKF